LKSYQRYVDENKRVEGLYRVITSGCEPRAAIGYSISSLFASHVRSIVSLIRNYPGELLYILKAKCGLFKFKAFCQGKSALLIGNGPSQDSLTLEMLSEFQTSGGETICVNYWHINKRLKKHVPNWLVLTDPISFTNKKFNNVGQSLEQYLQKNPNLKIITTKYLHSQILDLKLENKCFLILDQEALFTNWINPMLPRGYPSSTLYKALACSLYLGYDYIGVIGMDNTYPRDIFSNKDNAVLNLERHAFECDYINDRSNYYHNIASCLDQVLLSFIKLECFPVENIFNLDPYSLTDRFGKLTFEEFFRKIKSN